MQLEHIKEGEPEASRFWEESAHEVEAYVLPAACRLFELCKSFTELGAYTYMKREMSERALTTMRTELSRGITTLGQRCSMSVTAFHLSVINMERYMESYDKKRATETGIPLELFPVDWKLLWVTIVDLTEKVWEDEFIQSLFLRCSAERAMKTHWSPETQLDLQFEICDTFMWKFHLESSVFEKKQKEYTKLMKQRGDAEFLTILRNTLGRQSHHRTPSACHQVPRPIHPLTPTCIRGGGGAGSRHQRSNGALLTTLAPLPRCPTPPILTSPPLHNTEREPPKGSQLTIPAATHRKVPIGAVVSSGNPSSFVSVPPLPLDLSRVFPKGQIMGLTVLPGSHPAPPPAAHSFHHRAPSTARPQHRQPMQKANNLALFSAREIHGGTNDSFRFRNPESVLGGTDRNVSFAPYVPPTVDAQTSARAYTNSLSPAHAPPFSTMLPPLNATLEDVTRRSVLTVRRNPDPSPPPMQTKTNPHFPLPVSVRLSQAEALSTYLPATCQPTKIVHRAGFDSRKPSMATLSTLATGTTTIQTSRTVEGLAKATLPSAMPPPTMKRAIPPSRFVCLEPQASVTARTLQISPHPSIVSPPATQQTHPPPQQPPSLSTCRQHIISATCASLPLQLPQGGRGNGHAVATSRTSQDGSQTVASISPSIPPPVAPPPLVAAPPPAPPFDPYCFAPPVGMHVRVQHGPLPMPPQHFHFGGVPLPAPHAHAVPAWQVHPHWHPASTFPAQHSSFVR
uniref:Uncharacterized protein n=1 Tax=Chromera velia CCMP2878 TaxID=1169474 RepID=A0A0G4HI26_9ALVE|eukprot:Cvel_27697.t1-p1 / transcript=Cvel_27697.t1 / gene=Cvel_27697 / organism=Chromera_velia_CCMP2878 / gene_product=hypothetical protein / transcript_product=hypothetical protein / location=Cvel_scaffold3497:8126-11582(+) / protein_length=737 / sequence_SO=supercontig / SO=protein_coding / is_pseudo=false